MQYTESGKEEEIDKLRSMAYDIISNYNIILCNWVKNNKSSSHDDRTSLMKTQISKHYKIHFGHEMYNRYIKRASFLPTHDYFDNLVNVKAVVYGAKYQKVESLEAALEIGISKVSNDSDIWYNNNKVREIKNVPVANSLAMKALGIKPQTVEVKLNSEGRLERNGIFSKMETQAPFKFKSLGDEEVISLTSVLESQNTKTLTQEIEEALNFESLTNIKF